MGEEAQYYMKSFPLFTNLFECFMYHLLKEKGEESKRHCWYAIYLILCLMATGPG